MTVVSGLIMVLLFFSELQYYLAKEVSSVAGGSPAARGGPAVPRTPRSRRPPPPQPQPCGVRSVPRPPRRAGLGGLERLVRGSPRCLCRLQAEKRK